MITRTGVRGRVTRTQSSNESSNADELDETDANHSVHIGPGYPNRGTASALSEPLSYSAGSGFESRRLASGCAGVSFPVGC